MSNVKEIWGIKNEIRPRPKSPQGFWGDLCWEGFPGGAEGKASACNAGDLGSMLGRSPGEGNGNPLQYSWLENSMDGGAW